MIDEASAEQPRVALVLGARNLGRALIEALLTDGWHVAAAARSDPTLAAIRELGALALRADLTDGASVEAALGEVAGAYRAVGLVVNAAAAYGGDRSGPFGGGRSRRRVMEAFGLRPVLPPGRRSPSFPGRVDFCWRRASRRRSSR